MAGKYAKLELEKFKPESSYQEKLEATKQEMQLSKLGMAELGQLHERLDRQLDDLETQAKALRLQREAVDQELLEAMEEEDLTSFKLKDGTLVYQQSDPYASLKDKEAFRRYIDKFDLGAMLSVNYQTMSAMCKDLLVSGEPLPDGVEVFMKTSVRLRRGRA